MNKVNNFDKRISDEIHARTVQDIRGMKDDIWNGLEKELFSDELLKRGVRRNMNKRKRVLPIIITIAAGLLIVFSLQTSTGTAVMKGIKEMFVPEKEIIQNIEGMDEETDVQLNEGTNAEYVLYIDETRYKLINGDSEDIITTIDPLPEGYPEVTMEIKQVLDTQPEVLVKNIESVLKQDFPDLREIEEVIEPVRGFQLHGAAGNEAKSKIVNAYVISNEKDGSFVITQYYFLEAAEGHGARFHHMLESFEIVE